MIRSDVVGSQGSDEFDDVGFTPANDDGDQIRSRMNWATIRSR